MTAFTKHFDNYVVHAEKITGKIGNTTYTAIIEDDPTYSIDDDDMHNSDRSVTGLDDKKHAEIMVNRAAFFKNEWWYGTITVIAERNGWTKTIGSIGGLECNYPDGDNNHLMEAANDLVAEFDE